MNKKLPIIIGAVILAVVVIGLVAFLQKPQPAKPAEPEYQQQESSIQMVDLKTQPKWVQDLKVTAERGKSANGLENFTLTLNGLDPKVSGITYTIEYQTLDKGIQGTFSSKPVDPEGETEYSLKTMDLGTCSTKSCVKHTGVKELTMQLDFATPDGPAVWTGIVPLN